jgi:hypothetical protein
MVGQRMRVKNLVADEISPQFSRSRTHCIHRHNGEINDTVDTTRTIHRQSARKPA